MDGHRSYPQDEERTWYPYPDDARHGERRQEDGRYDEERYRVPEPRYPADPGDQDIYQRESAQSGSLPAAGPGGDVFPRRNGPESFPVHDPGAESFPRDGGPASFPPRGTGSDPFRSHLAPAEAFPAGPPAADAFLGGGPVPPTPGSGGPAMASGPAGPVGPTSPGAPAGPAMVGGPTMPVPPTMTGGPAVPGGAEQEEMGGRFHTEPIDRAALRRPSANQSPAPAEGVVYRTRRAGIAAFLVVLAIVAEILLARVLLHGEFGDPFRAGEAVAGIFAMTGVPLVTMGLYGLMTGAAATAGPAPARAWLRTPLAYLPIGLALLIAAALAVR